MKAMLKFAVENTIKALLAPHNESTLASVLRRARVRVVFGVILTREAIIQRALLQRDLQPPPVPKLDHTLNRFLEYASVVATEQQLQQTKVNVEQFRRGDGPNVQAELEKLAIRKDNWVEFYSQSNKDEGFPLRSTVSG